MQAKQEFLEKDIRLHALLRHLTQDAPIAKELVFKGGTCLIKCYLGYYRFSVDLDFTWLHQSDWHELPAGKARDATRFARHAWVASVEAAAKKFGYGFDPKAIIWGATSRMATANLSYKSLSGQDDYIKIQINFIEPLLFPTKIQEVQTLISGDEPKALRLLDDADTKSYREGYSVVCYDPREIAAEKCRAILTRKAAKGRDVLDVYLLEKKFGVRIEELRDAIQAKLDLAMRYGDKYADNMELAEANIQAIVEWDYKAVVLDSKSMDRPSFDAYRTRALAFVRGYLPK